MVSHGDPDHDLNNMKDKVTSLNTVNVSYMGTTARYSGRLCGVCVDIIRPPSVVLGCDGGPFLLHHLRLFLTHSCLLVCCFLKHVTYRTPLCHVKAHFVIIL